MAMEQNNDANWRANVQTSNVIPVLNRATMEGFRALQAHSEARAAQMKREREIARLEIVAVWWMFGAMLAAGCALAAAVTIMPLAAILAIGAAVACATASIWHAIKMISVVRKL